MKNIKIFLLIPILLFLVGCEYHLSTVDYNSADTPNELPIAETNEVNDKIVFDFNIETDEVLIDGRVAWSVVFATEVLLSEYDLYVEFLDNEVGNRIAILPYIVMYDFRWIEVGNIMIDGVFGTQFYERSVLYSVDNLLPSIPFVVTHRELGILPHRGISFVDESGERRYFAIMRNQAEPTERLGNFIIREFDN